MIEKQESEAKSEREETREKLSHVGNVAKMREALLIIAGGKEARGNYEEVAWHMAQLAAEALAAKEGGEK